MYSVAFLIASELESPSKNLEFTAIPFSTSVNGSSIRTGLFSPPFPLLNKPTNLASNSSCNCSLAFSTFGIITGFIGKLNLLANSKSLVSCAGTAIIAPVPYVINT